MVSGNELVTGKRKKYEYQLHDFCMEIKRHGLLAIMLRMYLVYVKEQEQIYRMASCILMLYLWYDRFSSDDYIGVLIGT